MTTKLLADIDYILAVKLNKEDPVFYERVICFHLQQAIEKYLKYYIEFKGYTPPRTHSIRELCNECKTLKLFIPEKLTVCGALLERWQFASRYDKEFIANSARINEMISVCEFLTELVN